jgi:hypothetical protein
MRTGDGKEGDVAYCVVPMCDSVIRRPLYSMEFRLCDEADQALDDAVWFRALFYEHRELQPYTLGF